LPQPLAMQMVPGGKVRVGGGRHAGLMWKSSSNWDEQAANKGK
jgi:hypothetical protein